MITPSLWMAAGTGLLLACSSASAQQATLGRADKAAPSAALAAPAPSPGSTGQGPAARRDSPGASKPAGFNPRFSPDSERFFQQGGENLYRSICQGCHMPQGQGAQGAGFYPALAQNARLAAGAYAVHVVLNGLHGMPPFGERLSDQQVADVVNYVRTHFGNGYSDAVTPEAVQGQRR